jgi:predicted PurR-regulated permease PerM
VGDFGARWSDWMFFRRVSIAAAVLVGLYLVWQLSSILLLLFAAILFATLIAGASDALVRHTVLGRRSALITTICILLIILGGIFALFGARISSQLVSVFERAPEAVNAAGEWLGVVNAFDQITQAMSDSGIQLFSRAATIGYTAVNAVGQLVLVMVAGIYLASDPELYRVGVAKLFPPERHPRIMDSMTAIASALRLWFVGQLFSMALIGTLSAIAFTLIGLPIPLGLGAIAGITNFIPLAGPIIGSLPALLFAFTQNLSAVLWTVGAIFVIQQIENYIATPLIQRQVVALPPAVLLFALVALGFLFGWLGVILAAPLTVAIMVLVKKLWVRDVLGEPVKVPGEDHK